MAPWKNMICACKYTRQASANMTYERLTVASNLPEAKKKKVEEMNSNVRSNRQRQVNSGSDMAPCASHVLTSNFSYLPRHQAFIIFAVAQEKTSCTFVFKYKYYYTVSLITFCIPSANYYCHLLFYNFH